MLEPQGLIPRAAYEGNEGDDGVSKTKSESSSIHIPVGSYRNPPVREPEITETYIRGQRACWCTWWQRFRAYIASRKENVFNVAKKRRNTGQKRAKMRRRISQKPNSITESTIRRRTYDVGVITDQSCQRKFFLEGRTKVSRLESWLLQLAGMVSHKKASQKNTS